MASIGGKCFSEFNNGFGSTVAVGQGHQVMAGLILPESGEVILDEGAEIIFNTPQMPASIMVITI